MNLREFFRLPPWNAAAWSVVVSTFLALGLAFWVGAAGQWSDYYLKQTSLGADDGLQSPVGAIELARHAETVKKLLSNPPDPTADRKALGTLLERDNFFAVGYALLFLLLGLRARRPGAKPWELGLLILPAVLGLCDLMENQSTQKILHDFEQMTQGMVNTQRMWSLCKWETAFLLMVLLGAALLGQIRVEEEKPVTVFFQGCTALVLVGAGLVGGLCLFWPTFAETGFSVSLAAFPFLLGWLLYPDRFWQRR